MLRSPSSLRSLFHLSGRLLRPLNPRFPGPLNPPLPSSPRSTRRRFLSSSSSPTPGGAGWATYDYARLIESLCASASDAPVESDAWFVYDPVAGRIVIQRPPLSSSSTEEEEGEGAGEREDEGKAGVKDKEKGEGARERKWKRKRRVSASVEEGQTSRSSVAAARKSAGKGGKERVSYVCSVCGEGHPRWWGYCCHCKATRTLQKSKEMVPQSFQEVNNGIDKGKRKRKERASASGEMDQTSQSSVAAAPKSAGKGDNDRVSYVCSDCGEGHSQWWGICRNCDAMGTLHRRPA